MAQIQEVKTKRVVAGAAARPRDHDFEALSALEMRDQWVICVQGDRYTAEGFAVPVDAPPYKARLEILPFVFGVPGLVSMHRAQPHGEQFAYFQLGVSK